MDKAQSERAYWLAWSQIKNVGPVTIKHLWEHFGSLALAWKASAGDLLAVDGIGLLSAEKIVAQRPQLNPNALLAQHEKNNPSFWTPADPEYPALLFAINDPPPLLYYRGVLRFKALSSALTVGIVGTRSPSPYGKRWTQRLSSYLTRQGAMIVSGLAAGIDTEAHKSCLKQGGLTIAVLGTGVDVVYPRRNQGLYQQIVETGLVVSEYPDGTAPDKTHFPQRNRIIAGLSRATLVTEAPARSGALITSRLANDYCREVYALPCALDNRQGEGCLRLINDGAQMILGEQALTEALQALPPVEVRYPGQLDTLEVTAAMSNTVVSNTALSNTEQLTEGAKGKKIAASPTSSALEPSSTNLASISNPKKVPEELSPLLTKVLNAVPLEPTVLDVIVHGAQVDTGAVLGALVQLELSGLVVQLPGMQYQRA